EDEEVVAPELLEAREDLVGVHASGAHVEVAADLLEDAVGLLLVRVEDREDAREERVGADLVDARDALVAVLVAPEIEVAPLLSPPVREEEVDRAAARIARRERGAERTERAGFELGDPLRPGAAEADEVGERGDRLVLEEAALVVGREDEEVAHL